MKIFEFESVIKSEFLKKYYHNNVISKFVDLSDFETIDSLTKVLTTLLNKVKLVKICDFHESSKQNFEILKVYEKPKLPKCFLEALKLATFDDLVIQRDKLYKIKYADIAKLLNLPVTNIKKELDSYVMWYGDKQFYFINKSSTVVYKYSFIETAELKKVFETNVIEPTVMDENEISTDDISDFSDDEEETSNLELREFQCEELELMFNNTEYYFSNAPRCGTTMVIATYVKRRPEEKILIVVSRKTLEQKYKNIIKSKNAKIILVNEFKQLTDTNFDTIICDECHNDYTRVFDITNPVNHRSKFKVESDKEKCKTFYFSSTIPNSIDFNKFYDYSYSRGVSEGFLVPVKINLPKTSIKNYIEETKSKHILIINDSIIEPFKFDNTIKISKEDTFNKRSEKIKQFLSSKARFLIAPSVILEGLDLPICDEVILYNVNPDSTNIIQICGRCLERVPSKDSATITFIKKFYPISTDVDDENKKACLNLSYLYQYFSSATLFDNTDDYNIRFKKYFPYFSYDFITDYKFCLEKLNDSFDEMKDFFDKSLINTSIIKLFTKSDFGKTILKNMIDEKFDKTVDSDYIIDILAYNGEYRELKGFLKDILSKRSENTSVNNTYCINGYNYHISLKPKLTHVRSLPIKKSVRKTFYDKYATSIIDDTSYVLSGTKFYVWKEIKPEEI